MNPAAFTALLFGTSVLAGLLGALTGLGGALSSFLRSSFFSRSTSVTRSGHLWSRLLRPPRDQQLLMCVKVSRIFASACSWK
jgi:hypothetical protein